MSTCATREELRQLLNDQMLSTIEAEVLAHVETCVSCQQALEALTVDSAVSSQSNLLLPPAGDQPATTYWARLKKEAAAQPSSSGESGTAAEGASFASPSPSGRALEAPAVASHFGPYFIHRELGCGGMGRVFLAEQKALKRFVALKFILPQGKAHAAFLARFHTEAEAVARLHHPNIVQIHEVGERDGLSYLSLEYLEGGSLDDRLAAQAQAPRDAARLLATLARAVAHAHEHGIVHRDLKPANVLFAADGTPKLTDFGLAKHLERQHGQTETGAILGTPGYMAPEQALGDPRQIGPAADVYGLGAVFYEMLTGRPPFKGSTPLETITQTQQMEPVAPRVLAPHVPRDLDTICLKCLQKDPRQRYASANALADDLQRFLDGQPIQARPTGLVERSWKWAKRHPAAATLLLGGTAGLLLLLGVGLYYNVRLQAAVREAMANEQRALRNAETTAEQRDLALKAVNDLLTTVQARLQQNPATEPLWRSLRDTAVQRLQEVAASTERSEPDLSRAEAHLQIGDIFARIGGHTPQAMRQFEWCLHVAAELLAAEPRNGEARVRLCRAHYRLGQVLLEQTDKPKDAQAPFRHLVELTEAWYMAEPDSREARRELIRAYDRLGHAHLWVWELPAAGEYLRRALALAQTWVEAEPDNPDALSLRLMVTTRLAALSRTAGDPVAARDYHRQCVEGLQGLVSAEPDNVLHRSRLQMESGNLAQLHLELNEFAPAREYALLSARLARERSAADPENVEFRCYEALALSRCGLVDQEGVQFAEALRWYRQADDLLGRLDAEGRLKDRRYYQIEVRDKVRDGIALCEKGPQAALDVSFALRQPQRMACDLLLYRVRLLVGQGRLAEATATIQTLCDLRPDTASEWMHLARTCARCIPAITQGKKTEQWTPAERAVQTSCTARAVEAVTQAVERGYKDLALLERSSALLPIRQEPGFRAVLERLRGVKSK